MSIFQPLATRSHQRPPSRASRNKELADSTDSPGDADKPDNLNEFDISDDSAAILVTS